jgi:hypothetical protein
MPVIKAGKLYLNKSVTGWNKILAMSTKCVKSKLATVNHLFLAQHMLVSWVIRVFKNKNVKDGNVMRAVI